MRSFASSSCSNSSSSSYSLAPTSLNNRLNTIFKKASELCTLCEIEVCVVYYGPDGELTTWPEDRQKVRDIALRYSQLNEAQRHKKSFDLYGFMNKKKHKEMSNPKKKVKKTSLKNLNELKYPISDHYSSDQISQMIQSLELNISTLQERLRLVESQRPNDTKLDHHSLNSVPLTHHDQTQSSDPSQFSLFMCNHGDATLAQIPLSASNFNQLMNQELCAYDQNLCMSEITNNNFQLASVSDIQEYSAFPVVQESGLENQLIQEKLYGCDENMCLGNINSNDFQHPCVSNKEHYSTEQESVDNFELNQFRQHELWGYDQNMFTSDITNSNIQDPYNISNIVSDELYSDLQDHYGNMLMFS